MAALAGITIVLCKSFYGGFVHDLSVLFLDVALCWRPNTSCKRRLGPNTLLGAKSWLPSWSWVGWKGELDLSTWKGGCDYIKNHRTLRVSYTYDRVIPIVQWYSK